MKAGSGHHLRSSSPAAHAIQLYSGDAGLVWAYPSRTRFGNACRMTASSLSVAMRLGPLEPCFGHAAGTPPIRRLDGVLARDRLKRPEPLIRLLSQLRDNQRDCIFAHAD